MKCYCTNINIKGSAVWWKEKKLSLYIISSNNYPELDYLYKYIIVPDYGDLGRI